MHEISSILLYPDIKDGDIKILAKEKEVYWNSANRIAGMNTDFKSYVKEIKEFLQVKNSKTSYWN